MRVVTTPRSWFPVELPGNKVESGEQGCEPEGLINKQGHHPEIFDLALGFTLLPFIFQADDVNNQFRVVHLAPHNLNDSMRIRPWHGPW